ncbi:MAG TPA: cytochrome-c peroxidase [Burkholderiales bacterium]
MMETNLFKKALLAAMAGAFASVAAAQTADEPIKPLPLKLTLDARKVELGKALFNDKRLSKDNSISCASCHDMAKGGADGKPTAVGIGGQVGPINTPTVLNSSFNFRQFWNGRAATLEEQAAGPVHNPGEMGSNWDEVLPKLRADSAFAGSFAAVYKDGLKPANIQDAIAAFERSLVTPSRFDRYLRGDLKAISEDEARGYTLFKTYGCVACHQGVNVGGNMYQQFGVMDEYFKARGKPVTEADLGRYAVTKAETDRHVFKVPGLRNVELTAPYFHDGSAGTLDEAVDVMFRYQLGRTAPASDKSLIVKFLKTLTGEKEIR